MAGGAEDQLDSEDEGVEPGLTGDAALDYERLHEPTPEAMGILGHDYVIEHNRLPPTPRRSDRKRGSPERYGG